MARAENSTTAPIKGWRPVMPVTGLSQSPKSLIFNNFFLLKF
jgi:hypothetical protein